MMCIKLLLKNTPDLLHSKISSMAALFEKCGVNVEWRGS